MPQRAPAKEAAVEPRRQQPAAAPLRLARERQREARVVVAVRESNAHDGQIRAKKKHECARAPIVAANIVHALSILLVGARD